LRGWVVINEISASVPIFYQMNLTKTSLMVALKNFAALIGEALQNASSQIF